MRSSRRWSYVFLCVAPFLAGGLVARPLRIDGFRQAIGAIDFAAICFAVWNLGSPALKAESHRLTAFAAMLLLVPFVLVALLWVGLGTPWEATPIENRMRYLVLLTSSMAVAGGFILLKEPLHQAGERLYSTLGFAANIFAGTAYLVWLTWHVGFYVLRVHDGKVSPDLITITNLLDILLFCACVLTYLATAAFAASLGRIQWLGRGAARTYIGLSLLAVVFIVIRGLSFPDPKADSTPWYLHPGFIAGIPAVPWIMPYLLGVVVLRRAGDEPI